MSQAIRLAFLALAMASAPGCGGEHGEAPRESVLFATRREHLVDIKPTAILAADLDGDGRSELVATDAERGELRVWNGREGPIAGPGSPVAVGGWPLAPVVLPATSGGKRLVAVASRARKDVAVLDPLGEKTAREVHRFQLESTPRAMAAGELLGLAESTVIAVACDGGLCEVIFPGSGGDRDGQRPRVPHELVSRMKFPIADGVPRCALVLADGSGVVVGYQDRRSLVVVDVAQAGRSDCEIAIAGIPRALCEADLDGDGDLELAAAGGDDSIWVLGFGEPGGSNAWRRKEAPRPLTWDSDSIPIDLQAADLDGDGRSELVGLAFHGLAWSVLGGFTREGPGRRVGGYAGQTSSALALLDEDGDGRLDLAVANRDSQSIGLARGSGTAGFAAPDSTATGRFPTAVLSGDLGADRDADLVVVESKDDTASILISRGGTFERGVGVLHTGPDPRGACLADLDGDDRIDLVLVADDAKGSSVRSWFDIYRAQRAEPGPRVGHGVRSLLAADFNGDGRADLVAADAELGQVILLSGSSLEVGDGPCALAAIRIDGDEAPEIAVALGGPGSRTGIALLDVEGGTLRETGRIATGGSVIALDAADLDGDGREDLAVLVLAAPGSQAGEARAYLRRGDGFELAGTVPVSAHPRSIEAGDLDGDGLADIVVAAQYAHRVDLAFARPAAEGRPWRLESRDALGAGIGCMDAILVDIDRDGDLDVVVANGHSDDVSVIRVSRP